MHALTTPSRRMLWLIIVGIVLLVVAQAASGQASVTLPVVYELAPGSTFQRGCYEPCLCPLEEEVSIHGTFRLTRSSADPLFTRYAVTDVHWTAPDSAQELVITGSGTYRVGGEVAVVHQLELDLSVNGEPVQHFDSGLVPGGAEFPKIDIVISINGMYCYDTVIHVVARPIWGTPPPMPRHAQFALHPGKSNVDFTLFAGSTESKLLGGVRLFLGDPSVPVISIPGMVGLSVDGAELVAPDFTPDGLLPEPLFMFQDPTVRSIGAWNTYTGEIAFELHLTTRQGELPVPQPLHLAGTLANSGLLVSGCNGNIPDGTMCANIVAFEVHPPPPPIDLWFSTEIGFGAGSLSPSGAIVPISDGDLLSPRGYVVRTNHELTVHLGIMPVVPDLGLDAVVPGPFGQIWFSFEEDFGPIWSESLGRWLKPGDLLSDAGYVVRTNEELLAAFMRMPPVPDDGLDAVVRAPNRDIWFSTEQDFFSESLGVTVRHGDLLSVRGRIVRTNAALLANFHPMPSPAPMDYGLDAVILRPQGEIWFSTEVGFHDEILGPLTDGDLLSTRGYVVARNRELVAAFGPVEDVDNFGLDAASTLLSRRVADLDCDSDVDLQDYASLQLAFGRPDLADELMSPDFDGNAVLEAADYAVLAGCLSGPNIPSAPDCGE